MYQTSVIQRKRKMMRTRVTRRVLPFLAALFLATPIAMPVAKSVAGSTGYQMSTSGMAASPTNVFDTKLRATYNALGAEQQGLKFETFAKAITGYLNLREAGQLANDKQLLTVVDFDLPSTEKRLWVFDLATNETKFHTLVAHGHNSGENEATNFSNTDQSNMSSLGFYATSNEYQGKHGRSLRLEGLDEGFNTNASARSVVMHGADYVSEAFIKQNGRLGRSLGCPALPMDLKDEIIEAVNGGTCLFINKSNAGYDSKYLNQEAALTALVSTASATATHS